VEALDHKGNPVKIDATGWYARILQHEIDHLYGRLYIDHMLTRSFTTNENASRYLEEMSVHELARKRGSTRPIRGRPSTRGRWGVERLPILLLPGMDGTGILFRSFRVALPPEVAAVCEDLSLETSQDHRELAAVVHPPDVPYAVLGESFSGPLALLLADRDPNARAVVLAASFSRCPSRALSWLWPLARGPLLGLQPPDALVRHFLLGEDAGPLDLAPFRLANRFLDPSVRGASCGPSPGWTRTPSSPGAGYPSSTSGRRTTGWSARRRPSG
jgi:hypothetical protein